jgi:hypothetical protein
MLSRRRLIGLTSVVIQELEVVVVGYDNFAVFVPYTKVTIPQLFIQYFLPSLKSLNSTTIRYKFM